MSDEQHLTPDHQSLRELEKQRQEAEDERKGFEIHLWVYCCVIGFLFLIDVFSGWNDWWFYWPALAWGMAVMIHYGVVRIDSRDSSGQPAPRAPQPSARVETVPDDVQEVIAAATAEIDNTRAMARQIRAGTARTHALAYCASADQVIATLGDVPDEVPIAREFLESVIRPARQIIGDYVTLSTRNVPSARETLERVEAHDLPQLAKRADAVFDRLHRGTLIDLQVAREMLALESPLSDPELAEAARDATTHERER